MKKTFIMLLVIVVMLSLPVVTYGNQTKGSEVALDIIFQAREIKDLDVLFERANNGITDVDKYDAKRDARIINESTGIERPIESVTTTQLLSSEKSQDGTIRNRYVTTSFASVYNDDLNITGGLRSKYDWANEDRTFSVRAYSTIYWSEVLMPYGNCYELSHVAGGWTILDSQASLSNRRARLAQNGWAPGGYKIQRSTWYNVNMSWLRYNIFNWVPVATASYSEVGAAQTVRIHQQGSTWNFAFGHYITHKSSATY